MDESAMKAKIEASVPGGKFFDGHRENGKYYIGVSRGDGESMLSNAIIIHDRTNEKATNLAVDALVRYALATKSLEAAG